jgi:programmed cell death protein 5
MSEDPELDELRKKRQADLQKQLAEQEQQQEAKANYDVQRQRVLITLLTDEARTRLNNIKLANPEFATSLENQLIQLSQSGRIRAKITDDQLKTMLRQIQDRSRTKDINITRK